VLDLLLVNLYHKDIIHLNYGASLAAQHALQVTPLARPAAWCIFHARSVPSFVPIYTPASVAPEGHRWAALTPTHRAEPSGQPERPRINGDNQT